MYATISCECFLTSLSGMGQVKDNLKSYRFFFKAGVTTYLCGRLAIVVRTTLLLACHYCGEYFLCGPVDFGANDELMFRWGSFPLIKGRGSLDVFFQGFEEFMLAEFIYNLCLQVSTNY